MNVLWQTEDALSASEIAERIPDRNWPASSIQNILRGLEKKNAIKVASITRLGKSFGRLFRPTLSANEYAIMQFHRFYQNNQPGCYSMISSLLGSTSAKNSEIIASLQMLLKEYENREE
ncbi:MAG: BlaI/MecI/CopY family transcriptional regulator [Eubacterium sp.]|nr:BlaI/MecI/CopY family transcriptional regulator [Eubacterium sp.]